MSSATSTVPVGVDPRIAKDQPHVVVRIDAMDLERHASAPLPTESLGVSC